MDHLQQHIEQLAERDGLVIVCDLVAMGWDRAQIRRKLGDLTRLRQGAYALTVPEEPEARYALLCRATIRQQDADWCLSHASAAVLWRLPLIGAPPLAVHLTSVDRERHGGAKAGLRLHGRSVPRARVVLRDGLAVTDATTTVVDCARTLPANTALAIADAALAQGLVSRSQIDQELALAARRAGIARARMIVRLADPRSESPGESWCRLVLITLGYQVETQVTISDAEGFVARVDFRIAGTNVLIEFDGRIKYQGADAALWQEKRRQDRLTELGYEVVRVVWADLTHPARVRHLVERALERSRRR